MKFRINNGDTMVATPLLERVTRCIRSLPDGDLMTTRLLATRLGVSFDHISGVTALVSEELFAREGNKKLYGNPKTVAAWKKQRIQS